MNAKKPKGLGLMINVPLELAREIYTESGDLPFAKFPAIMNLVDNIVKALNMSDDERVTQPKPTIMCRSRKTTSAR